MSTTETNQENKGGFINSIKELYSPKSYIFIGINILSFIILFFVLSSAIGSVWTKAFAFIFCIVVGGLLGAYWASKSNGDAVKAFRNGAGTLLVFFVGLMWMNDGYVPRNSSGSGHTCLECGRRYSGYGWRTIDGEQYQPTSDNGDQYCSRSCAYNSQF